MKLWKNGSNRYLFVLVSVVVAAITYGVAILNEPSIILSIFFVVFIIFGVLAGYVYQIAALQQKTVNKFLAKNGFTKLLPEVNVKIRDGKLLGLWLRDEYIGVDNGAGCLVIGGICALNIIYHHFSFENRDEDMMVIREEDSDTVFVYGR